MTRLCFQAGLGLFQLVVAEFIFSKILAVVFPYLFMALAWVKGKIFTAMYARHTLALSRFGAHLVGRRGKPAKHYVRPQFDVAKKMVNLLYFTQLSLMVRKRARVGLYGVADCIVSRRYHLTLLALLPTPPSFG